MQESNGKKGKKQSSVAEKSRLTGQEKNRQIVLWQKRNKEWLKYKKLAKASGGTILTLQEWRALKANEETDQLEPSNVSPTM